MDHCCYIKHAISAHEQEGVPVVRHTVNHRFIDDFYAQFTDVQICSLMCFSCARVLVCDAGNAASPTRLQSVFSYNENGCLHAVHGSHVGWCVHSTCVCENGERVGWGEVPYVNKSSTHLLRIHDS